MIFVHDCFEYGQFSYLFKFGLCFLNYRNVLDKVGRNKRNSKIFSKWICLSFFELITYDLMENV